MKNINSIFNKNYKDYLKKVAMSDFSSKKDILGIEIKDNKIDLPFLNRNFNIFSEKITDQYFIEADYSHCVLFCNYLLQCPDKKPIFSDWVSYNSFKDSAPLINYFENNTHLLIANAFTKNIDICKKACDHIGGQLVDINLPYDLVRKFYILPKIPILFLFNDSDEEFQAVAKILFENCAEQYLDAECIAVAGTLFAQYLIKSSGLKIN